MVQYGMLDFLAIHILSSLAQRPYRGNEATASLDILLHQNVNGERGSKRLGVVVKEMITFVRGSAGSVFVQYT